MITLANAAAISSAAIKTLHEEFQPKVRVWFDDCCQAGLTPYVYEGLRSDARQAELHAKGRTTPGVCCRHHGVTRQIGTCPEHPLGKPVTNAEPGQSYHNYGFAIDWVPLIRVVKAERMYEPIWDKPGEEEAYKKGQEVADKHGMKALSWEQPHLQDLRFADWRELKEKYARN